jgi:MFS transporter, PAT family, beta-lactamase induction signal transducer AmpG
MLLLQSLLPLTRSVVPFITAGLFITECGANLLAAPLGALMADAMPDQMKGRAAAWYQFGGKIGTGAGGGMGLWLAIHTGGSAPAGVTLGLACVGCIIGLALLDEPERHFSPRAWTRLKETGIELWRMLRSRDGLLVAALALSPIGISGVDDFWSAVAQEWGASARMIVLVTGFASAAIACAGCLVAGWWADNADRRRVYLATGTLVAAASALLAIAPHVPRMFVIGTLTQKFAIGMSDAAIYALFLHIIGRSAAATKFAVLAALGNVGELYMTLISGWVHDHRGSTTMLLVESGAALAFIIVAALLLRSRVPERAIATSP